MKPGAFDSDRINQAKAWLLNAKQSGMAGAQMQQALRDAGYSDAEMLESIQWAQKAERVQPQEPRRKETAPSYEQAEKGAAEALRSIDSASRFMLGDETAFDPLLSKKAPVFLEQEKKKRARRDLPAQVVPTAPKPPALLPVGPHRFDPLKGVRPKTKVEKEAADLAERLPTPRLKTASDRQREQADLKKKADWQYDYDWVMRSFARSGRYDAEKAAKIASEFADNEQLLRELPVDVGPTLMGPYGVAVPTPKGMRPDSDSDIDAIEVKGKLLSKKSKLLREIPTYGFDPIAWFQAGSSALGEEARKLADQLPGGAPEWAHPGTEQFREDPLTGRILGGYEPSSFFGAAFPGWGEAREAAAQGNDLSRYAAMSAVENVLDPLNFLPIAAPLATARGIGRGAAALSRSPAVGLAAMGATKALPGAYFGAMGAEGALHRAQEGQYGAAAIDALMAAIPGVWGARELTQGLANAANMRTVTKGAGKGGSISERFEKETERLGGMNAERALDAMRLAEIREKAVLPDNARALLFEIQKAKELLPPQADPLTGKTDARPSPLKKPGKEGKPILEDRPAPENRPLLPEQKETVRDIGDSVQWVPSESIKVDPERFQFKMLRNKSGETGSIEPNASWNEHLAGILLVWKDPADGNAYVVNGHNRLAHAIRTGQENVLVRFVQSESAKEARAVGALANIAEGHGTAFDAAKFFRDSGLGSEDLSAFGLNLRSKIAEDGLALSNLHEGLFSAAIRGEVDYGKAVALGKKLPNGAFPAWIKPLLAKKLSDAAFAESVDFSLGAPEAVARQEGSLNLFGGDEPAIKLAAEKGQASAAVRQRILDEKRAFGTISKDHYARLLKDAGNVLDIEGAIDRTNQAAVAAWLFDRMKILDPPTSRLLDEAAMEIYNGESPAKAAGKIYERIRSRIEEIAKSPSDIGRKAPSDAGSVAGSESGELAAVGDQRPNTEGLFEGEVKAPSEPAKAEPAKAEPAKAEPAKVEPAKAEPAKVEPAKVEPAKAEPAKVEPAKAEPAKAEPAKTEPVKAEPVPSTESPRLKRLVDQNALKRAVEDVKISKRADLSRLIKNIEDAGGGGQWLEDVKALVKDVQRPSAHDWEGFWHVLDEGVSSILLRKRALSTEEVRSIFKDYSTPISKDVADSLLELTPEGQEASRLKAIKEGRVESAEPQGKLVEPDDDMPLFADPIGFAAFLRTIKRATDHIRGLSPKLSMKDDFVWAIRSYAKERGVRSDLEQLVVDFVTSSPDVRPARFKQKTGVDLRQRAGEVDQALKIATDFISDMSRASSAALRTVVISRGKGKTKSEVFQEWLAELDRGREAPPRNKILLTHAFESVWALYSDRPVGLEPQKIKGRVRALNALIKAENETIRALSKDLRDFYAYIDKEIEDSRKRHQELMDRTRRLVGTHPDPDERSRLFKMLMNEAHKAEASHLESMRKLRTGHVNEEKIRLSKNVLMMYENHLDALQEVLKEKGVRPQVRRLLRGAEGLASMAVVEEAFSKNRPIDDAASKAVETEMDKRAQTKAETERLIQKEIDELFDPNRPRPGEPGWIERQIEDSGDDGLQLYVSLLPILPEFIKLAREKWLGRPARYSKAHLAADMQDVKRYIADRGGFKRLKERDPRRYAALVRWTRKWNERAASLPEATEAEKLALSVRRDVPSLLRLFQSFRPNEAQRAMGRGPFWATRQDALFVLRQLTNQAVFAEDLMRQKAKDFGYLKTPESEAAWTEATALAEKVDKKIEGLRAKWNALKEKTDAVEKSGESALPDGRSLGDALDALRKMQEEMRSLAQSVDNVFDLLEAKHGANIDRFRLTEARTRQMENEIGRLEQEYEFLRGKEALLKKIIEDAKEPKDGQIVLMEPKEAKDLLKLVQEGIKNTDQEIYDLSEAIDSNRAMLSPEKFLEALRGNADGIALQFIKEAAVNPAGNKVYGPGLAQALSLLEKGHTTDFSLYVAAKRSMDYFARGMEPGLGLDESQTEKLIAEFEANNPDFATAHAAFVRWEENVLQYLVDAGHISPSLKKAFLKNGPNYAPFARVFEGKNTAMNNLFHLRGGERPIYDPVVSAAFMAQRAIGLANKTLIKRQFVDYALRVKDPTIAARVEPPKIKDLIDVEKFRATAEQAGIDIKPEVLLDIAYMFGVDFNNSALRDYVPVRRAGRVQWYKLNPVIFETLEGPRNKAQMFMHNLQESDAMLYRMLRTPTEIKRLFATGINTAFGLAQIFMDGFGATVQSPGFKLPMSHTLKGFAQVFGKDAAYAQWVRMGGEIGTMLGQDRPGIRSMLDKAIYRQKGTLPMRAKMFLRHPLATLRDNLTVIESAPRAAEFKQRLAVHEKKYGKDSLDAAWAAMRDAKNVTVNFTRKGMVGGAWNMLHAYFNAPIQESSRIYRIASGQEGRAHQMAFFAKALSYLTAPSILLWLANRDNKEYQELPTHEKVTAWHFWANGRHFQVRKPFSLGNIFGSLPEAVLDSYYQEDPRGATDAAWFILEQISPVRWQWQALVPDAVGPLIEAATNKNWLGMAIEPDWMTREKFPKERFSEKTTGVAKIIGETLGVSPVKVDHVLNAYLGGMPSRAYPAATGLDFTKMQPFVKPSPMGDRSQSVQRLFEELEKARWTKNSEKLNLEEKAAATARFRILERDVAAVAKFRKMSRETTNPEEKERYERGMTALARKALGRTDKGGESLPEYPFP